MEPCELKGPYTSDTKARVPIETPLFRGTSENNQVQAYEGSVSSGCSIASISNAVPSHASR